MATIFMQANGYTGNATASNYSGWIELDSVNFSANNPVKMCVGDVSNRQQGKLSIGHITVLKGLDNASNDLLMAMCKSKTLPSVDIHFCHGDDTLSAYAKWKLDNVMIAKYTTNTLSGSDMTEALELAFTKIQKTYIKSGRSPNTVGYDLETAQPM